MKSSLQLYMVEFCLFYNRSIKRGCLKIVKSKGKHLKYDIDYSENILGDFVVNMK